MKKTVIIYSIILLVLLFILKIISYRYFIGRLPIEVYIGIIAIGFTIFGIWIALKITKGKDSYFEKKINTAAIDSLEISKRELDVLNLIVRGMSNQEIADKLFISLSTVKTHTSNLFVKMDVKRRTQAIQKALDLNLVKSFKL